MIEYNFTMHTATMLYALTEAGKLDISAVGDVLQTAPTSASVAQIYDFFRSLNEDHGISTRDIASAFRDLPPHRIRDHYIPDILQLIEDPVSFTPIHDRSAIVAAVNEEALPQQARDRIAAIFASGKTPVIAVSDSFPLEFDAIRLNDHHVPHGMPSIEKENEFLRAAHRVYEEAEQQRDGSGYDAVGKFISEQLGDKALEDRHGIDVAIQLIDSFQRASGSGAGHEVLILHMNRTNFDIIPESIRDQVVALNISMSAGYNANRHRSRAPYDRIEDELRKFIDAGIPVFSSAGNTLERAGLDSYRPPEAVVIGGQFCGERNPGNGVTVGEGLTEIDTDIAITVSTKQIDRDDCPIIQHGTSFTTPHVAATWLASLATQCAQIRLFLQNALASLRPYARAWAFNQTC